MDIDLLTWLQGHVAPARMVTPDKALPGRPTPVLDPVPTHEIFGLPLDAVPEGSQVAYFALGCYWGEERMFWERQGVVNTAVGFMGGYTPNPTYAESCTGRTGHTETVRVVFDPARVGYDDLLQMFWENHDPTQLNRQGNDAGTQYRSALFPVDEAQRAAAEASLADFQGRLAEQGFGTITTEITPGQTFYFAEVEHQQYLHKVPDGYCPNHATGVKCGPRP
ncbi:peptide-methionine (S)-S-oxide reductase [Tessaracoccus bendigoensis DSM 12906]|uniref:Peptide methionine sulfoxide reductase MsrA n=1 Tax=Tessaracoccus bendigoensis DSM 12906 TaxID=1123357 RepID=A0A1M6F848_9ACTN|nr:peptide-methionine (S)-S-oxide reductase MsrA [Tessaracoccus bendigoensis]SHI93898.1 peptide-methionine (S)-S-oxide reductase [Tessaracoccus bendigoensis DSM 12906]